MSTAADLDVNANIVPDLRRGGLVRRGGRVRRGGSNKSYIYCFHADIRRYTQKRPAV